jgi:hypothetical protein
MELPVGKQNLEFWQGHVEAADKFSGTIKSYCEQHGLSKVKFGYYQQKFRKKSKFAVIKPITVAAAEPRPKEIQQQKLPEAKWLAALIRELAR